MNIPLNIDIQQILLHALNFVILGGGLYMLLYKPVCDFMKKREEYFKGLNVEAEQKKSEADKLYDDYNKKILDAEDEIAKMKQSAQEDMGTQSDAIIADAHEKADKIVANAKLQANLEHDQIIQSAQEEIAEMAASAIKKISQTSVENSYDDFLNAAYGGTADGDEK